MGDHTRRCEARKKVVEKIKELDGKIHKGETTGGNAPNPAVMFAGLRKSNTSDNNDFDDELNSLSWEITRLVIMNQDGEIKREYIQQVSLELANILQAIETSLADSAKSENEIIGAISEKVKPILRQIFI